MAGHDRLARPLQRVIRPDPLDRAKTPDGVASLTQMDDVGFCKPPVSPRRHHKRDLTLIRPAPKRCWVDI